MPDDSTPAKSEQATREDFLRKVRPPDWRNPQPRGSYDLAIVGAGPAGVSAAEFARRQGRSVALLERRWLGGNSLNAGSIPSKAIIRAAQELYSLRDEEDYGAVAFRPPKTDFTAVMARMRRIRTRLAEYHSAERLTAQGTDLYFCDARFAGPKLLLAGDTPLSFDKAIVATGARPRPPDIRVSIGSAISPATRYSISPNCPDGWESSAAARSAANWPRLSAGSVRM